MFLTFQSLQSYSHILVIQGLLSPRIFFCLVSVNFDANSCIENFA